MTSPPAPSIDRLRNGHVVAAGPGPATPADLRRGEHPSLSGVRAVAAYLVIGTHVGFLSGLSLHGSPAGPFLARMRFGVTIFFLLSGFLLSRRFMRPAPMSGTELRQFWWRRGVRVLPAYWLAIVGTLTLLSAENTSAVHWASYLLLVHPYSRMPIDSSLSQMWTLVVEVSFYALLPLLFVLARRFPGDRAHRNGILVAAMAVAALAGNLLVHGLFGDNSHALLWMPLYLDWFALGIALAAITVDADTPAGWQRPPLRWARSGGTCWVIGGLLYWLSTLPLAGPRDLTPLTTWEWTFQHLLFGAAAFFLLLPLVVGAPAWQERLLGNPTMRWFGEISYGVYLWHLGLLIAIHRWLGYQDFTGHFVVLYLATAAAATVVAAGSWYLVERPLLRRFSRSWRRTPVQQAAREDQRDRGEAEDLHAGTVGQGVG